MKDNTPTIADAFTGFFTGETPMERYAKQRFTSYRNFIEEECKITDLSNRHHRLHRCTLILEFSDQAMQLQRWGLTHILPFFRMQAWLRISRCFLLEEITSSCSSLLKERVEIVSEAMDLSLVDGIVDKYAFLTSRLDDMCVPPDIFTYEPEIMVQLKYRLGKMDKLCQMTLRKFKIMLPELESKEISERKEVLIRILARYKALTEIEYPDAMDTMSWDEFTEWYQQKHRDLMDLERGYGNFVEDDREKEGRLFRRWCTLANSGDEQDEQDEHKDHLADGNETRSPTDTGIGSDEVGNVDNASASVQTEESSTKSCAGSTDGNNFIGNAGNDTEFAELSSPSHEKMSGITATSESGSQSKVAGGRNKPAVKLKLSPRTITAFTKYFSKQVMAPKYKCPPELIDTLVKITENIVFRRINSVTLKYPNKSITTT